MQKWLDRSIHRRPVMCFCAGSCLLGVAMIAPALKKFLSGVDFLKLRLIP